MAWTKEQTATIEARGCNLLVSAAAGSGKTAVLVERILRRVMVEKIDVDRLLVVTFTKAAAAEMKERIGAALEKQLEEHPEDEHLQRQTALVYHAAISTIDSFCLDVVRSHLQDTNLDPAFRIAEEGEIRLLEQDVMSKLLEEEYTRADPAFLQLVENIEPQNADGELGEIVLMFYHFSQAYPWPSEWRKQSIAAYEQTEPEQINASMWMQYLMADVRREAREGAERLRVCYEQAAVCGKDPKKGYKETLRADIAYLEELAKAEDYETLYQSAHCASFARIGSHAGEDEQVYARAKKVRDEVKDRIKKEIVDKLLAYTAEQIGEILRMTAPVARALVELTDRFEAAFAAAKARRSIVDFSDIEHEALHILVEKTEEGCIPTEAAREYAEQYEEVMIDEYQDSNEVQEILLYAVSREAFGETHNRFMVGDVKQSIYRFRQADPQLFMQKHSAYPTSPGEKDLRIELHHNFRSRREVLEGVNMLFRQIMQEDVGGVQYDEEAALHPAFDYPEGDDSVFRTNEILLVHRAQEEEQEAEDDVEESQLAAEGEDIEQDEREAMVVARRIGRIVGHEQVYDKAIGAYRPAEYGDIAILLRSTKGHAEVYARVLTDEGIPAYAGGGTGYFDVPEVRAVLSFLAVLDNPHQDIPLAALLRSPMGGFGDEELALIRLYADAEKPGDLWDSLRKIGEDTEENALTAKVRQLLLDITALRAQVELLPIHELIWRILEETGYLDYVTALPAGAQRRANLNMLVEKAVAFESGSYRGLFHFLRYIENLKNYEIDYGEAPLSDEGAGSVRIMSIHKSKGLEFPIVFVCSLGRKFNEMETRGKLIMHGKFGIGLRPMDLTRHVRLSSPVPYMIGRKCLEDGKGEEIRIQYVALTRAREKLILVGQMKESDTGGDIERWIGSLRSKAEALSYTQRNGAKSPLDLIMRAALRHSAAKPYLTQYHREAANDSPVYEDGPGFIIQELTMFQENALLLPVKTRASISEEALFAIDPTITYDVQMAEHLQHLEEMVYPYGDIGYIPSKVSVSFLKQQHMLEEEQEMIPVLVQDREKEVQQEGEMRGASYGTLVHSVMENLDFTDLADEGFWESQLESMIKCGKIHENERQRLKKAAFLPFLRSALAKRMQQADRQGRLHREAPFVVGEPARVLRPEWDAEEMVLVQGIIDAWFMEEDGIVLLDYKTDRVSDEAELIRRYQTQLDIYAEALARILEKPVKEKLIWSFALGRQIICP